MSAERVIVVGAGVHGLSTALHLAEKRGFGEGILVLDKGRVGAGASGISGGIVRNFYLSAPMNEIVRRSVEVFELDPELFGFRQVGYLAVVPEAQAAELERIAEQHREVGYESTLVLGEPAVARHMESIFPDWRARGSTALLHERRSGWADPSATLRTLEGMARAAGVEIREGVEVTGLERGSLETTAGELRADVVVLAPGPWARDLLPLLDDAPPLDFHVWQVREGEYVHAEAALQPTDPVVHLDADVPVTGFPLPWGIYFRPSLGQGLAIGGLPLPLAADCELDPYGPSHPELGQTSEEFDEAIIEAITWALGRFEGPHERWRCSSYGAQTCFTPDSYPVVDWVAEDVYAVLDSNHGFKMLALGELAAAEILGTPQPALEPFRLERFGVGAVHPASASPYPWT
ncbi:MAG: FAD-binding oxidoreductase [Thermoleophilia bacterium]|nr:FAD-binding oxidoreductase [Gaiellaceae bacterium]MDW8337602.1 FAD-binding oxidoreductase [Thermoleophilia bacterium]